MSTIRIMQDNKETATCTYDDKEENTMHLFHMPKGVDPERCMEHARFIVKLRNHMDTWQYHAATCIQTAVVYVAVIFAFVYFGDIKDSSDVSWFFKVISGAIAIYVTHKVKGFYMAYKIYRDGKDIHEKAIETFLDGMK